MNREYISEALGSIDDRHISESGKPPRKKVPLITRTLIAAVLVLAVLGLSVTLFLSPKGVAVTAYAHSDGRELTSAGAGLTTGTIDARGVLTGHPLMFHLDGKRIESVRFSCKNEVLSFTDMTENRAEYGFAQNFTVEYGENESQYPFLVIDWVPQNLIKLLREGKYETIAQVPAELREDLIVMEVRGLDGGRAVKAITVKLLDDGTFYTSFVDFEITGADEFVRREDAKPLPKWEVSYGTDKLTVEFLAADGTPARALAGWYDAADIDAVRVTWIGRDPIFLQMFYTATGTEMLDKMVLLETRLAENADKSVYFSGASLPEDTMGHVWFVAVYDGSETATTDVYNVASVDLE